MEGNNKLMEYIDSLNFQGDLIRFCREDEKILKVWLELSRLIGDNQMNIEDLGGTDDYITPLVVQKEADAPLGLLVLAYFGNSGGYMAILLDDFIGMNIFPILSDFCDEYTICKTTQTIYAQIQLLRKCMAIDDEIRLEVSEGHISFNYIESFIE